MVASQEHVPSVDFSRVLSCLGGHFVRATIQHEATENGPGSAPPARARRNGSAVVLEVITVWKSLIHRPTRLPDPVAAPVRYPLRYTPLGE
jgi:hypothetical protein